MIIDQKFYLELPVIIIIAIQYFVQISTQQTCHVNSDNIGGSILNRRLFKSVPSKLAM